MKRILLPTDFSENAFNAASYALHLFKDEPCTFYLLNTYTPGAYHSGMMLDSYSALQFEEITRKNALRGLDSMEERLMEEYKNKNHKIEKRATFNLLIDEILTLIKENNIDLIIMGTKGATGAKEVFLGTNTMYAIKKSNCPVIAVPSGFSFEPPKEILFTTDFKFNIKNKHLSILRDVCTTHISRLNILNVYYGVPISDQQEKAKNFLDSYFDKTAHLFHEKQDVELTEAIAEFQIKNKINFMVMIHNKHSFFENLLFKPVINELVYHTNVPFLVIPSEKSD
jgi:nucleotide-binding universal stress UspA family protein